MSENNNDNDRQLDNTEAEKGREKSPWSAPTLVSFSTQKTEGKFVSPAESGVTSGPS